MVVPHLDELVTTLTDPFVVPLDSPTLQASAAALLLTVFQAVKGMWCAGWCILIRSECACRWVCDLTESS